MNLCFYVFIFNIVSLLLTDTDFCVSLRNLIVILNNWFSSGLVVNWDSEI